MDDATRGQVAAPAAEVYEELFVPALFGQFASTAVELSGVDAGGRLLDVGTGTGIVARCAVDTVGPSGEVVGIDVNPSMLSVARRSSGQVVWLEAPAERIPYDADVFDAATCQFALMFFEDPSAALAEMARVVKPGGRVVVSTWADVSQSPGYAAAVDLLEREISHEAADALMAPFSIGTEQELAARLNSVFGTVEVRTHPGTARFDSLETWMHTDIRGWTLSEMIDDDDFERLVTAARHHLKAFVGSAGRVRFAAPAIVGVATSPR